jgi:hypothetical protein
MRNCEWIITKDHIWDKDDLTDKSKVGRCSEGYDKYTHEKVKKNLFLRSVCRSWKFRLYDDDGILYYEGEGYGEVDFDPLDWATAYAGCTKMTYNEGWRTL